jgi:endoglucanase
MKKPFVLTFQSFMSGFYFTIIMCGLLLSTPVRAQLPTAQQISSQMKVGWNLGNTLESPDGETSWGGTITTQAIIDKVKASGFNTVRVPVAWFSHSNHDTNVIDAAWLARVKQVVDYCMKANMYVIINSHWDRGWLDQHINVADSKQINARQYAYWTQIANTFKDYGDHLLFAGTNEPPVDNADQMSILLSYHQSFVNAVRATGGNNSSRTLVIQGPSTDIEKTNTLMNVLPTDKIANRLMVEVHYYSPSQFAILEKDADWGNMVYYWGNGYHSLTDTSRNATWGEESFVDYCFGLMKTKYIDKGIPVILGEFAAPNRNLTAPSDQGLFLASRQHYYRYVVKSAISKGLVPICWDRNKDMFDRTTLTVLDQATINSIMIGAGISKPVYVTLTNAATRLLMDGMYRFSDGSSAGQYANSGSGAQQWEIETIGSYVRIKNKESGLYLDGLGSNVNSSTVSQKNISNSYNQQWQKVVSGNYIKFKNRATGLYIDGLGKSANGIDLGQYKSSSSYNQQWTITTLSSTSKMAIATASVDEIENQEAKYQITLYPNPFSSAITLQVDEPNKINDISIFDMTGKLIESIQHSEITSSMSIGSSLTPNIYIVKVSSTDGAKSFKIIKK